ncbi:MAG: response regulator [Fusobacteriaceae bacterium]|jgi:two-component system alkaline phosphatase synthesis response regulator PhoP|nr:response regulator [Fusobacteriaceae bacterium]MBP6467913.1 response regulator [Fusobacteriaceae bacterium]MBP9596578.1 response regulator [Fusobacteriaceae bacterium]MBU9918396.1 response regulator [Fusobacteriaceae bacterium]
MGKKILVADDEKHIVQIVQFNLEKKGNYEVIVASDGEMALELIRQEKPDLVISDIMMPKMTGFELFEALRKDEEIKDTPFIILTAKGQDSYFEEGQEKGILHILTKPFSPKALLAIAKEILGE